MPNASDGNDTTTNDGDQDDTDTRLINAATSSGTSKLPPGDIHRVMS